MRIRVQNLSYRYPGSEYALGPARLEVQSGESVALTGPSGCGKTTFLNLLSGLMKPDAGTITVGEVEVEMLTAAQARSFRAKKVGHVFQDFGLLDYLSAFDNILYPHRISAGRHVTTELKSKAEALAQELGVSGQLARRPAQLSHGERQRIAICRAVLGEPKLLLADEPTGNLDPETKRRIMDVLMAEQKSLQATMITVTHDHDLLPLFDRVIDFSELAGVAA